MIKTINNTSKAHLAYFVLDRNASYDFSWAGFSVLYFDPRELLYQSVRLLSADDSGVSFYGKSTASPFILQAPNRIFFLNAEKSSNL